MRHFRWKQDNPAVIVLLAVLGEEALTEGVCVLDGAEPLGELGTRAGWHVSRIVQWRAAQTRSLQCDRRLSLPGSGTIALPQNCRRLIPAQ